MLLPVAYRSLSRLSSALSARASAPRPSLLNLVLFKLWFSGPFRLAYRNVPCSFIFFRLPCSFTAFSAGAGKTRFSMFALLLYSVFKVPVPASRFDDPFSGPSNGDGEIRTHDPLLARQVLSQLSYTPKRSGNLLLSHIVSNIVPSAA